MSKKIIYLIRHGETEYNKLGLVQGSGIDASLNELGQAQAKAFYKYYKNIPFSRVYTSNLQRTHQSVAGFLDFLPWTQFEGLNEISWGSKEGRIMTEEDDRQYFAMIKGWQKGEVQLKSPGGESPLEVQERQKKAWEKIMDASDEPVILVCMHGRAIRILLCLLLGLELKYMDHFSHRNLCLYLLSYDTESKTYSVEKENDIAHLAQLNNQGITSNIPVRH